MHKSNFAAQNIKEALFFTDEITRQFTVNAVAYVLGYSIARVREMAKNGAITRIQQKALEDILNEVAEDTINDIRYGKKIKRYEADIFSA